MKYFSFSQKWENAFSDHISFATRFVMFDWEEASLSTSLGATNVKPLGAVHDVLRVNLTDTRSTHCAVCSKQTWVYCRKRRRTGQFWTGRWGSLARICRGSALATQNINKRVEVKVSTE